MKKIAETTWDNVLDQWAITESLKSGETSPLKAIKDDLLRNNFVQDLMSFIDIIKWEESKIESQDIAAMFVINSCDWLGFADSYKLEEISA